MFHPDRDIVYELHAINYAQEAKGKNLKPGDVVTIQGILRTQLVERAGETLTINHFTVSHIDVLARAKRQSVTIFEYRGK